MLDAMPLLAFVDANPEVLPWAVELSYPGSRTGRRGERLPVKSGWQATVARSLQRARASGTISFHVADQVCCVLGVHMAEIWPDDYWIAPVGSVFHPPSVNAPADAATGRR